MKRFTLFLLSVITLFSALLCSGCSCSGCGGDKNISCYEIECSLKDNLLSCKQKVTFYNDSENAVKELKFNLYGNAFRKGAKYSPILSQYQNLAYPNGVNYGEMQINSCTQKGKPLKFEIGGEDQNVLVVYLPKEIFPEERVVVEIDFCLVLANVVARTGINDKSINLGNFYPILCVYDKGFYECNYYGIGDPFYSECANYVVTISAPSEYKVAGGGEKVKEKTSNGVTTTTFSLKKARSFAMVLSKDFQIAEGNVDDVKVSYYYYQDQSPKESLKYALRSLTLFNNKFGKYPYSHYSVVQTQFVQGGMEYPTITFISDNLEPESYGEVIVHETAHQWWQTVVGNNEIEHGFLDEGLTEYSVVLFYENYSEYGLTRQSLVQSAEKTYKVFCSVVDRLEGKVDTTMLRSLSQYSTEYEYVNVAYIKSCIMFDYLRKTIGDQRFFKGLKKYYKDYSFNVAKPYDLVGTFEKIGADTNGFFESFYNGKVII